MAVKVNVKGPIVTSGSKWMYDWLGMPACSPGDVEQTLTEANGDEVILEINSNGGVATAGFEIYTMLMEYEGKVTAHIVGAAMSAASIIACAADNVLASDTSIFMIHNTQSYAEGDYRDMQMEADALQEFNESVINAYVRKTKMNREELQELMDKNTYMSVKTAIEKGFIDDYMFGNPDELVVVNSSVPIFTNEMVKKFAMALKRNEIAGVTPSDNMNVQDNSNNADSDKTKNERKEGKQKMTLEEFLKENPEENAKVDQMLDEAKAEGTKEERTRLKDLDKLAKSVTSDVLEEAKYGEHPKDAKTLAYEAMVDDSKKAAAYMQTALSDSKDSKVNEVGFQLESEENKEDEKSSKLASHVNHRKGVK